MPRRRSESPFCDGESAADDDDGQVARRRIRPQPAQELVTGAVGQVQVEQDQVRPFGAREAKPVSARVAVSKPHVRPPRERPLDQLDVHGVVLDVQHGAPCRSRDRGRRRRAPARPRARRRARRSPRAASRARRASACPPPCVRFVAEEQLQALRVRGERLEAQRAGGTAQAVRLERAAARPPPAPRDCEPVRARSSRSSIARAVAGHRARRRRAARGGRLPPRGSEDSQLMRGRGGLRAPRDAELLVAAREQRLHRLRPDAESLRDLAVRGARREQPDDLALTRAQRGMPRRPGAGGSGRTPRRRRRRGEARSADPRRSRASSTEPCAPASRAASFRPGSARAAMMTAGVRLPSRRSCRTSSVPRSVGKAVVDEQHIAAAATRRARARRRSSAPRRRPRTRCPSARGAPTPGRWRRPRRPEQWSFACGVSPFVAPGEYGCPRACARVADAPVTQDHRKTLQVAGFFCVSAASRALSNVKETPPRRSGCRPYPPARR